MKNTLLKISTFAFMIATSTTTFIQSGIMVPGIPNAPESNLPLRSPSIQKTQQIQAQGEKKVMQESKTIVIAGGAGFIGANLCRKLAVKNYNLIILDSLATGSLDNISPLLELPNVQFIEHNILKPLELKADYIINLACPASPPRYQQDPIGTTLTNVLGTHNLLQQALRNNAIFVQSSTSEVYGDPLEHPQKESYRGNVSCIGPRACYDEGKRCAESLCFDYARMYQARVKVARIFNTYGPYMDPQDGRVVSNFIVQALTNQPITIYGTGKQTRSFCYVDDLTDGLIALMLSPDNITGPINLGNNTEYTLLELASTIISMTGSKQPLTFAPLPEDDPTKRKPDISTAKNILQWQPKTPLVDGLVKTISYFKKKLATLNKTEQKNTQHMPSIYG